VEEYSNGSWDKTGRNISAELVWKEGHEGQEVVNTSYGGEHGTLYLSYNWSWYGNYTAFAGFYDNDSAEGYWNSTVIEIVKPNMAPVAQGAFALAWPGDYGSPGEVPPGEWRRQGNGTLNRTGFARVFFSAEGSYDPDEEDNGTLSYCWIIYRNGVLLYDQTSEQRPEFIRYEYVFDLPGNYEIMVKASDGKDNGIDYANLYLNLTEYAVPDLQFLTPPDISAAIIDYGENATVFISIRNGGNAPAQPFDLYIEDYVMDIGRVLGNHTMHVEGIPAESGILEIFRFATQGAYVGNHSLRITLDPGNTVEEWNESDNQAWVFCRVVLPAERIPLPVIKSVKYDNTAPEVLMLINITVTVANEGAEDARWVMVRFYEASEDITKEQSLDVIMPGGERKVLFTFRPLEAGQHTFAIILVLDGETKDSYSHIVEVKESDFDDPFIPEGDDDDDDPGPNWIMMALGLVVISLAMVLYGMVKAAEKALRRHRK